MFALAGDLGLVAVKDAENDGAEDGEVQGREVHSCPATIRIEGYGQLPGQIVFDPPRAAARITAGPAGEGVISKCAATDVCHVFLSMRFAVMGDATRIVPIGVSYFQPVAVARPDDKAGRPAVLVPVAQTLFHRGLIGAAVFSC